ncbi:hypothetical protein MHU86_14026 [Fragilaria crotonensis]|nr:hypothetical protein MHU86_14026 [Fragilaria crotonensis]
MPNDVIKPENGSDQLISNRRSVPDEPSLTSLLSHHSALLPLLASSAAARADLRSGYPHNLVNSANGGRGVSSSTLNIPHYPGTGSTRVEAAAGSTTSRNGATSGTQRLSAALREAMLIVTRNDENDQEEN